jgi:uncharacterized protein (UPF0332 family)
MSVKSEDFLLAAEQLLNNGSHEIDYRNCMSRAYYASFHAIAPLSNQLPAAANYQTKGSHDEKISKLTRCSSNQPEAKTLKADYHIDDTIVKSDAEEQLLKVKFLLKQIANLKTALQIP